MNEMPEARKKSFFLNPWVRLATGLVGLTCMIQGICGLNSAFSSNGLPSSQEVKVVAERSLKDMKQFKEASGGFSMSYPASWDEVKPKAPFLFNACTYKGVVNVNVTEEDTAPKMTAAKYAMMTDDQLRSDYPDIKSTKVSDEDIDLKGKKVHRRIQLLHVKDQPMPMKQLCIYAIGSRKTYVMTAGTLEDWYPFFEPTFNKMAESITFQ